MHVDFQVGGKGQHHQFSPEGPVCISTASITSRSTLGSPPGDLQPGAFGQDDPPCGLRHWYRPDSDGGEGGDLSGQSGGHFGPQGRPPAPRQPPPAAAASDRASPNTPSARQNSSTFPDRFGNRLSRSIHSACNCSRRRPATTHTLPTWNLGPRPGNRPGHTVGQECWGMALTETAKAIRRAERFDAPPGVAGVSRGGWRSASRRPRGMGVDRSRADGWPAPGGPAAYAAGWRLRACGGTKSGQIRPQC
jgi:hypothetical protein